MRGLSERESEIELILSENTMYELWQGAFLFSKSVRRKVLSVLRRTSYKKIDNLKSVRKYIRGAQDRRRFDRFVKFCKSGKMVKEVSGFVNKMLKALVSVYEREVRLERKFIEVDVKSVVREEFRKLPFYSREDQLKIRSLGGGSYEVMYVCSSMPRKKKRKLPWKTSMDFYIILKQNAIVGRWIGVYYPKGFDKKKWRKEMNRYLVDGGFSTSHVSIATCMAYMRGRIAKRLGIHRLFVQDPRRSFWIKGIGYKLLKKNQFKLYPDEDRGILLEASKNI